MYSIGDRLKDARMSRGLRVEDIQKRTNIRERYIIAIEEGNLNILPGESYARTFIKLYAEEVGFDGEQLAREFEEKHHKYFKKQEAKQAKKKSRLNKASDGNWATVHDSLPMIFVIVLLVMIVVAIYLGVKAINSEPDQPFIQSDSAETTYIGEAPSEQEEETEGQESGTANHQEINLVDQNDSTFNFQVTGSQDTSQEFELSTEVDTWTNIQVDGEEVNNQLLSAGESMTISLEEVEQLELSLGNAENFLVSLNGEEIDLPEDGQESSSLSLVFDFE